MTRRKQGWVFRLFSPDSDGRLSLNFHRFAILYISCDARSMGFGQYCLPKVSIGFKESLLPHLKLKDFFLFKDDIRELLTVPFTNLPDDVLGLLDSTLG